MQKMASIVPALLMVVTALCSSAETKILKTSAGNVTVEALADGLNHPWGMTFLPDGRLLFTERAGNLRILEGQKVSPPLKGLPAVYAEGQGGLLDVELDPDFDKNSMIYLSSSQKGKDGAATALGKGVLKQDEIQNFAVIFRQSPEVSGSNHFGSRIVFLPDKSLFLTLGERYQFEPAQNLTDTLGVIVRLTRDGKPAAGNPFVNSENAKPEIWTYGHRNIEAAAIDPATGNFWIGEMGPRGGDELNLIRPGNNYGWPLVSWGTHYNLQNIPHPGTRPDLADAAMHWTPVISPSGMIFYTGSMFPEWKGNAFLGGLTVQCLVRVKIEGEKAQELERIALGARIRDVAQAPDGSLYLLTDHDNGKILRISKK